jgi:uncharacterized membrane protein
MVELYHDARRLYIMESLWRYVLLFAKTVIKLAIFIIFSSGNFRAVFIFHNRVARLDQRFYFRFILSDKAKNFQV